LLLPDEYDRIHLDLAPFWALPRAEMRKRVRQAMDVKETFVLVVDNGTVSVEVREQSGSSLYYSQSNACYVVYRSWIWEV
jgi:beta-1,2-xylosyltransferase